MSEALSDVMSSVRDHAPSMSSVKDAGGAVRSHLPSVDVSVLTDHLPKKARGKRGLLTALLCLGAAAAAILAMKRRKSDEVSAAIYTPPLPRP